MELLEAPWCDAAGLFIKKGDAKDMRKETIKYTDFNGTTREETYYFNLTRAECVQLHAVTPGGLGQVLENIVKANDIGTIYATFLDLLGRSFGVKSDDGSRLIKGEDQEYFKSFKETMAFDELICTLLSVPGYSADFFNDVIPTEEIKDLIDKIDDNAEKIKAASIQQVK
jgi:hypothetical protein